MKGVLLFIIFSGCAWGGVYQYTRLKGRSALLTELADMTLRLEKVMGQQGLTLKEALEWIKAANPGNIQEKFADHMLQCWENPRSLPKDWAAAASRLPDADKSFILLEEREVNWLKTLPVDQARMLADPDRRLRSWVEVWQAAARTAQEKYRTRGPLSAKLGILIGAAVVALML